MFTVDTKIKTIVNRPEFAGYEYMAGAFPGIGGIISGGLKLKTMCKMVGTWNAQSMADGMNYLSEKARKGKVFHHIYSEAERQADPSKKLTGIAALPVEKRSKFVVVCAGGGYASVCSMVEAYPVIRQLNRMGYAAFRCNIAAARTQKHPILWMILHRPSGTFWTMRTN